MRTNDNPGVGRAVAKIEIISFFCNNPHTRDTIEGLSRRLFLDTALIAAVMEELVSIGMIHKTGNGKGAIYRLKASYATLEEYRLSSSKGDLPWM